MLAEIGHVRADMRLIGMAIKKRWDISPETKKLIIDRLNSIVSTNADDEVAIKAINQLRQMELQNQKDEQTAVLQSDRNRFLAIAERLGLGQSVGGIPQDGPSGDSVGVVVESNRFRVIEGRGQEKG